MKKMMKKSATVTEYLRAVPPKPRAELQKLRRVIKATAPDAVEGISYGMPAFKYLGRPLVYFAAFRDHCSLFPASGRVIAAHRAELERYQTSKGTIQFTVDQPLPVSLVRKLVKARMRENEAKGPRKS